MANLRDGIYGLAIGDAVGVPFEFKERGTFQALDMIGGGAYNLPPGTWSDDTSMTLATMKSIKDKGKIDLVDIGKNFVKWRYQGEFTPSGNTFAVGRTTNQGIYNFKKTGNPMTSGLTGERDNGNGSLMRILPLIFIDVDEEDIRNVSSITHGHEISIEGCRIYVEIGKKLLKGMDLPSAIRSTEIRHKEYERIHHLESLSIDEIKSTGYVRTTLEAALYILLKTDNFKDSILESVNLGNDTDTIAAVAGGLSGIIYGYDNMPRKWKKLLKNKELIEACIF